LQPITQPEPSVLTIPECHPDYDTDAQSLFPGISHVVLEYRRLTTQFSVSGMISVLARASFFLMSALSVDGAITGADEGFQYIIVAVADARLYAMPTLYAIMTKFQLEDLKTGQFSFVLQRLQSVTQFLEAQCFPVPPLALLPFLKSDPPKLMPVSNQSFEIRGFAVWALPTFAVGKSPAELCCTGDPADVAVVYAYEAIDSEMIADNVQTTPTAHGTLFHVPLQSIDRRAFIRIPDGNFLKSLPDLGLMSNLLVMRLGVFEGDLSLAMLPALIKRFSEVWPRVKGATAIDVIVGVIHDIQEALIGRSLPKSYRPTGFVDASLIKALRMEIPSYQRGSVYIDPRLKHYLCQLPNRSS
jgi:hypothetical protein